MSFAGITHLHLTGIVLGISPESRSAALSLLEAARSHGATVSFDPNLRLNLWPDQDEMRAVINAVAGQASVVLPGLGEGSCSPVTPSRRRSRTSTSRRGPNGSW